jgi:hypothetical protein
MSRFSICSYTTEKNDKEWKILSIFVFPYLFDDNYLDDSVAPYFLNEGPFDAVNFVGFPESIEILKELYGSDDSAAFKRMQRSVTDFKSASYFISISESDGALDSYTLCGGKIADAHYLNQEMQQSLQRVFTDQNGLVTASTGFHFAKPSKDHSTHFLRVANVLENSSTSLQIAFWLLSHIKKSPIKRIVVDTSGIDSVAFAFAYESVRRMRQSSLPIIESHHSYEGLSDLIVQDPNETLFLISASTSGSLYSCLVQQGALPENIVTLFYLGEKEKAIGTILCNLTAEKTNVDGLQIIKSHSEKNCPHCISHSYAIPIAGDQFSTEPVRIEEIDILLSDFKKEHRETLSQLASTDLFKVFRSTEDRNFEIYLDVDSMFSASSAASHHAADVTADLKRKWGKLIKRGMPIHLERIIYTSYLGAKKLAEIAALELAKISSGHKSELISSHDLHSQSVSDDSASLVISSCFDETHELMGISRDLRVVQSGGNTTYVAPIFRVNSERERKRIESNLTFGELGPKTFNLYSVLQIELPICESNHSWKLEYEKLLELIHWADMAAITVPPEIDARLALLRSAPSTGLSENLYWPSPNNIQLKLGADFTMIPNDNGKRNLSQADLFVIASSLFHQYRQGVPKKPRLAYKPYERTVISPDNFQRFSDGILQASFLRAARDGELGYSNCEETVSLRMFSFLCDELRAAKRGLGPALMEYLISFMIGRLTLHPTHQKEFLNMVSDEIMIPDWIRVCARFTNEQHQI